MIIKDRDRKIINFIEANKVATSKNIAELFFNNGSKNYHIVALRRLGQLVSYGKIKSKPAHLNKHGRPMTIYFIDKPPKNKNLKHAIAISNFTTELIKNGVEIVDVDTETYITESIRPDGIYKVIYNNKKRLFLVEFEITKEFNTFKYEYMLKKELWKDSFKKVPRIVCVSKKPPKESIDLDIIHLDPDLNNINILLSKLK